MNVSRCPVLTTAAIPVPHCGALKNYGISSIMAISGRVLKFCEFVAAGATQTAAAEKAGYSPKSASNQATKLMRDPDVIEWFDNLNKTAAEKLGITKEWVLTVAKGIVDKCTTPTQVFIRGKPLFVPGPNGEQVAAYTLYDAKSAVKANELIAKHLKMLTDKPDGGVPEDQRLKAEPPATPEEAARRYQEYMKNFS